jgi:hypothetical protein
MVLTDCASLKILTILIENAIPEGDQQLASRKATLLCRRSARNGALSILKTLSRNEINNFVPVRRHLYADIKNVTRGLKGAFEFSSHTPFEFYKQN